MRDDPPVSRPNLFELFSVDVESNRMTEIRTGIPEAHERKLSKWYYKNQKGNQKLFWKA